MVENGWIVPLRIQFLGAGKFDMPDSPFEADAYIMHQLGDESTLNSIFEISDIGHNATDMSSMETSTL